MNDNKIKNLKETNNAISSLYDFVQEKYDVFLELGFGFNIPLMIAVFGISAGVIITIYKFFGINTETREAQYAAICVLPTLYFFRKYIACILKTIIQIILTVIYQINKRRLKKLEGAQ